ncbi:Protein N-acetyltransferase, RimJ/RimL family [Halobacillus karajensis]|nr:GNAT family N-acetyltransferase [Halobacillus karajensis]SEI01899.1 Protein N-acetyltransferase, RimJ/RimL family [Halobacillus karajensis]
MSLDFKVYDKTIQRAIGFREATSKDVELVHKWMNEEHVYPFWNLNISFGRFKDHFQKALADTHQTLYLGMIDDEVMSYWESYWVQGDVLEKFYTAEAEDQGVHLLIGEKDFLGAGYALPLLRAMVRFQFQHAPTTKVVAEPDIRNEKMIHIFEQCGFTPVAPVTLPDKEALLMFCKREDFEMRWKDEAAGI